MLCCLVAFVLDILPNHTTPATAKSIGGGRIPFGPQLPPLQLRSRRAFLNIVHALEHVAEAGPVWLVNTRSILAGDGRIGNLKDIARGRELEIE